MADNELKVLIKAEVGGLKAGMAEASQTITNSITQMTSGFQGLNSTINSIVSGITSRLGVLGAGIGAFLSVESIKSAINATTEYAGEVRKLVVTFGMTAEAASQLNIALKIIGLSVEEFTMINLRMERQLKADEEKFTKLGITVRDANGAFLPQTEIFNNVIEKMREYKAGSDQIQFAMDMMGVRGAESAIKFLRLKGAMEMAGPIMKDLNLEMGQNAVEASKQFELQTNVLGIVFSALKINIGAQLMPEIFKMLKGFTELAKDVIPPVIFIIKVLMSVFEGLKVLAVDAITIIVARFYALGDIMGGVIRAFRLVVQGDFTGAVNAIKSGWQAAKDDVKASNDLIRESGTKLWGDMKKLWSNNPMTGGTKPEGGTKEYVSPKEAKYESRMGEWEAEYIKKEMIERDFFKDSTAKEMEFWNTKLALTKEGSKEQTKEREAVLKKIYDLEKKQAKESLALQVEALKEQEADEKKSWTERIAAALQHVALMAKIYGTDSIQYANATKEKNKLTEQGTKAVIEAETKRLDAELTLNQESVKGREQEANTKQQLGFITASEEIKIQKDLENELHAMELEKLNKTAALWLQYPEKYQEVLEKIALLKAQHENKIKTSDNKMLLETKKTWDMITAPIESAINTSIRGIIQGTTTLRDAIRNLTQSIVLSFIDMGVKMALEWTKKQLMMLFVTQSTKSAEVASTVAADTTIAASNIGASTVAAAAKITEAGIVIPANAGMAASAAAASQAAIPVIGPVLAAAAAAAMFALVIGYMVGASAECGYDIPGNVNPVTQLHAKEMVLPAPIAESIRLMAGGRIPGSEDSRGQGFQGPRIPVDRWDSNIKDISSVIPPRLTLPGWQTGMPSQGYKIPGNVNPVTQLNANEMENIRNITLPGGQTGAAGGGARTLNIYAWDSKDVKAFCKEHGNDIWDSLMGPKRNFRSAKE